MLSEMSKVMGKLYSTIRLTVLVFVSITALR